MLAFVNTHASGGGRPQLFGDRVALTAWFDEHGLRVDPEELSDSHAAEARGLRDAVATVLLATCFGMVRGDDPFAWSGRVRWVRRDDLQP